MIRRQFLKSVAVLLAAPTIVLAKKSVSTDTGYQMRFFTFHNSMKDSFTVPVERVERIKGGWNFIAKPYLANRSLTVRGSRVETLDGLAVSRTYLPYSGQICMCNGDMLKSQLNLTGSDPRITTLKELVYARSYGVKFSGETDIQGDKIIPRRSMDDLQRMRSSTLFRRGWFT